MLCPRCGKDTMKPDIRSNAKSRYEDIWICDECGTAEGLLAFMNNPLPLSEWACFLTDLPQGDFKAVPGEQAWEEIEQTQLPFLTGLFERWEQEGRPPHSRDFWVEARRKCKGISNLWLCPFAAEYKVSDGDLLLRFRSMGGRTEVAYDVIGGK